MGSHQEPELASCVMAVHSENREGNERALSGWAVP